MHATAPNKPVWMILKGRRRRATADHLLRHFAIVSPPVDVERLAKDLGATIVPVPNPGWSGAIETLPDGRATIWYASDESSNRRRFTIAHELGHMMLQPTGGPYHRDASFSGTPQELEANAFAADLLMPLWMLEPLVVRYGADVPRLARIFGVSEPAMGVRLNTLAGL